MPFCNRMSPRTSARTIADMMVLFLLSVTLTDFWAMDVLAQDPWCQVTVNTFVQQDGQPLDGFQGWTGNTAFTSQNSQASVTTSTGNSVVQIDKTWDASLLPFLTSTATFSATLTYEPNDAPFTQAIQFSNGNVVTASYGITSDPWDTVTNTSTHKFFGSIGAAPPPSPSANPVYATSILPQANTPYFIFGKLDFNYGGTAGLNRMRVWINPTFASYNAFQTSTADIDFTAFGPGIGNTMSLIATTNTDAAKTWADVVLGQCDCMEKLPRLQFKTSGTGTHQAGFEVLELGAAGTGPQSIVTTWDQDAHGLNLDRYGVEIPGAKKEMTVILTSLVAGNDPTETGLVKTGVMPGGSLSLVHETLSGGVADDLRGDRVEAHGGIELRIRDFYPDQNILKTFHYQSLEEFSATSDVDVWFSQNDGMSFTKIRTFSPGTGTDDATLFYDGIDTGSGKDLIYRFVPQTEGGLVGINGFAVVPEPSTVSLLGAAALMLATFCWRRRKT